LILENELFLKCFPFNMIWDWENYENWN
jgi:hypothetical protein